MFLKAGDTFPPLVADLNADLTGASAIFRISKHGTSVLSRNATVTDATQGIIEYDWVAGSDGAVINAPGAYRVEVLVTFSGGAVERFPQRSWMEIVVRPSIGVPA